MVICSELENKIFFKLKVLALQTLTNPSYFSRRGKFAVVKRCKHKKNGNDYAAKFLRKRRKGKDCRHEVLHEIHMLEVARAHPRLVDLVEVYENSHELILVTE